MLGASDGVVEPRHFSNLRTQVIIYTPDVFLNSVKLQCLYFKIRLHGLLKVFSLLYLIHWSILVVSLVKGIRGYGDGRCHLALRKESEFIKSG